MWYDVAVDGQMVIVESEFKWFVVGRIGGFCEHGNGLIFFILAAVYGSALWHKHWTVGDSDILHCNMEKFCELHKEKCLCWTVHIQPLFIKSLWHIYCSVRWNTLTTRKFAQGRSIATHKHTHTHKWLSFWWPRDARDQYLKTRGFFTETNRSSIGYLVDFVGWTVHGLHRYLLSGVFV